MTLAEVDWAQLRRPTVVLALSLIVSAAVLSAAHYYASGVHDAYRRESNRLASARGRYLALDDEKRLIRKYFPQYQKLARQGRIGTEQRLNWIEALRSAAARIKLPSLQYEVGAQQRYLADFPVETGKFEIFSSEMTLKIGLFHEEDLPHLLAELTRRATGLFTVSDCRVSRVTPEFQDDPTKANLEAQCRLRWLTIKPREDEPVSRRTRRRA